MAAGSGAGRAGGACVRGGADGCLEVVNGAGEGPLDPGPPESFEVWTHGGRPGAGGAAVVHDSEDLTEDCTASGQLSGWWRSSATEA